MLTALRNADRALLRDGLAISSAVGAVGVSFGAIAAAAGLPVWGIILMSFVVFAGGAQFMAVGLVAAGNPVAAVLAGLLVNARHLPFGLAVADAVGTRWWARLLGSHLMTDEAVAFAMAQPDPARRRRAYWITGVMLFLGWNLGGIVGVMLGSTVGDPAVLGLDAAFPAGLLALLLPTLRSRDVRRVVGFGAAVAVVTTPLLPAGLPILLALTGLAVPSGAGGRHRAGGTGSDAGRHRDDPMRTRAERLMIAERVEAENALIYQRARAQRAIAFQRVQAGQTTQRAPVRQRARVSDRVLA